MSQLESDRPADPLDRDQPVTVTYVFEDGNRRELSRDVKMTVGEADALARQGESRESVWDRVRRSAAWRLAKPLLKLAVVALVGGIIGAEISDRYADRQRELELEASLVTQVSRGAIELFQNAQEASRASENPNQRKLRDRAADDWVLVAGSITPVFRTYFGEESVSDHWGQYQQAMYDWAVLGCCVRTSEARGELIERIRKYLADQNVEPVRTPPVADPWAALDSAAPPRDVYQWLGFTLLRGRGRILDDLRAASPDLD
jgi:hypothetical protein